MITSFAKIISPYATYPEIAAAKFINITLSALTLIGIYLLVSTIISPVFSFLLIILVATNQINILYSMDVTNEVIYSFFLVLSLLIYHYQKKSIVYLLFGLLFLLRYESIAIPVSVFIIEHCSKKSSLKFKNILLSFIPIILWLIVLNFHSLVGNSIIGNAYLNEIQNGIKNLPNIHALNSLVEIITFDNFFSSNLYQIFSFITIFLCFYGITSKKTLSITKIIYLIFFFHFLFIYIFPNFCIRYYIPVIWIVYLFFINQKSKIISFTIIACLLLYNLSRINLPSNHSLPHNLLEYRLLAKMLNQRQFKNPINIIIYEPYILEYFVDNPQVKIIHISDESFAKCQEKLACIAKNIISKSTSKTKTYVVTTLHTQNQLNTTFDKYTTLLHHVNSFSHDTINDDKTNFKYTESVVSDDQHWANLYEYIPN
jgi:hypothetical protein